MPMNIGRTYAFLAVLVVLFCVATFVVLSTPSLQWSGVDDLVWPMAIGFLGIAIAALLFPVVPYGRRVISSCSSKMSFAIGYAILVCYTALGVVTVLLIHLRAGSGV